MNAWKHGERSAAAVARRREVAALLREIRARVAEESAALRRLNRVLDRALRHQARPERGIVLKVEFDTPRDAKLAD